MDDEIKNYKLILNVIRRVNRLLVRERDRDKLLHGICDRLIETSICSSAWIALFNDSGNLKAFAEAGLGELDLELKKMLECGQLPVCVQKALEQSKPILIKEPTECDDCPLAKKYVDLGRIIVRINVRKKIYGILAVTSFKYMVMEKAPCNINKIILKAIDYFQELCPARRFDITLPEKPVEITADKDKIDEVLKNIISNAIKYSPESSPVCLSVRVIQEIKAKGKQPAIEISVADKGIGMTSEQSRKYLTNSTGWIPPIKLFPEAVWACTSLRTLSTPMTEGSGWKANSKKEQR